MTCAMSARREALGEEGVDEQGQAGGVEGNAHRAVEVGAEAHVVDPGHRHRVGDGAGDGPARPLPQTAVSQ